MSGVWRDVKGARVPRAWYSVERPDVYDVTGEHTGRLRRGAPGEEVGAWNAGRRAERIPGIPARATLYQRVALLDGTRLYLVRGPARTVGAEQQWAMLGGHWGAHILKDTRRTRDEILAHWLGYVALNVRELGPVTVWVRHRRIT